jgi:hypothetical protein
MHYLVSNASVFRVFLRRCLELWPPCCQVYSVYLIPLSSRHRHQHHIRLKVDKKWDVDTKNCSLHCIYVFTLLCCTKNIKTVIYKL